jgi:hypothetical protein
LEGERMSNYQWVTSDAAGPYPVVFIANVEVVPVGDQGILQAVILDHPLHGAAWDALEEHGLWREVGLILDGDIYWYIATLDDEDDRLYLAPMDDTNDTLPENTRLLEKKVVLQLRW